MSLGASGAFESGVHPPPSFWSTSAVNQAAPATAAVADDFPAPFGGHRPQGHREYESRCDGAATADTVCSMLRTLETASDRRKKPPGVVAAGAGKGAGGGRVVGGKVRSSVKRLRPRRSLAGGSRREQQARSSSSLAGTNDSAAGGRGGGDSLKVRVCWGDDEPVSLLHESPSRVESRYSSRASSVEGISDRARSPSPASSPNRSLRWARCGSGTDDREGRDGVMHSPSRREGGQLGERFLDNHSRPRSPGSPRRNPKLDKEGTRGTSREELAFLQIQRDLLKRLEDLFVAIADDRRQELVALKREEDSWKTAAMQRARRDLRTAPTTCEEYPVFAAGRNPAASITLFSGSTSLEEHTRDRIAEEGPGEEAMRAVGLVRDGEDSRDEGESQSPGRAGERGRRSGSGGWRLSTRVVEEMRREFDRKMDQESAEVLEQENKALLEARARLAEREGARTKRELQDLSERLTNDGRDALASLRRDLEEEEEKRLAKERGNLKEALARALQQERERLVTERKLKVFDARDASGRESSQVAANLWEQAERSTSARREEAVRLLDEAADRARVKLDELLAEQEEQGLRAIRDRSSAERKAALKRVREEGGRRCLKELKALADGASQKNEAWLRMVFGGLGRQFEHGDESTRAGATAAAAENGMRGGGGGGGGGGHDEDGGSVSPALRLRAVEASNDCERLGRRLVELVIKTASMRLRESDFDVDPREHKARESGTTASATASIGNSNTSTSDVDKTITESQDRAHRGRNQHRTSNSSSGDAPREKRCQGCERLAHANVELTRVLLQTSTMRAREEARCSDTPVTTNTPSPPTTTAVDARGQGAARTAMAATTRNKHRAATTDGGAVNRKKRAPSSARSTKVVVVVSPTHRPKSSGRRTNVK
ncbi:unnamed protein product [Ectocarpus sp. 12 AP-2014]